MYLSQDQRNELKSIMETLLIEVKDEVIRLKELSAPVSPDNAIGRLSRMDAIQQKSINDAALNQANVRLKALEGALGRIDQDDFGICLNCEGPIPLPRLKKIPYTLECLECAREREN